MLLSLFCGAGGLDLGFEECGFDVGLAFDRNVDSVRSYNENRSGAAVAHVADVAALTLTKLDELFGSTFNPTGVVGGPPCQSFSQANVRQFDADPRHQMPIAYANLLTSLNDRSPIDFFVLENVVGLTAKRHSAVLAETRRLLANAGFEVEQVILDAQHYNTPQTRRRLFLVGFNTQKFSGLSWQPPTRSDETPPTVRQTIEHLPPPTFFERGLDATGFASHPNHWCMQPKSPKFTQVGGLPEGQRKGRSFKTLAWDEPSIAVAYGHREVHVHPTGTRRLSVFEAMLLQGFPPYFRLQGSMSSQFRQISEAVPVPLAHAVAHSIKAQLAKVHQAA